MSRWIGCVALTLVASCGDSSPSVVFDQGVDSGGGGRLDAATFDSAAVVDAARPDASSRDGGEADAAQVDAGRVDAAQVDAGRVDAAQADAAQADAAQADAAQADAAQADAGQADAGQADAGQADAGQADAGQADGPSVDLAAEDGGAADAAQQDAGQLAVICPADIEGVVLRSYAFEAQVEGQASSLVWSVLSAPAGFGQQVTTAGTQIEVFADVLGIYVLQFQASDDVQTVNCSTTLTVSTDDLLVVELTWNQDDLANGTDTSDLDLSLHRGATGTFTYYNNGNNCYWDNCATCDEPYTNPDRESVCREMLAQGPPPQHPAGEPWPVPVLDWDASGTDGDPRLDLDDVEGYGPELINLRIPEAGTYRVAVHYYDEDSWAQPAEAQVRVVCLGSVIYESAAVTLEAHGGLNPWQTNDFWEVGELTIDYGQSPPCAFVPFGDSSCHRICAFNVADSGGCPPAPCE